METQNFLNKQMITEFCTPAELTLCRQTKRVWNGYQLRGTVLQEDKNSSKRKRCSYAPVTFMCKNHLCTGSVCRRHQILAQTSMLTAPDDISRLPVCPAYRSSLGTGSRRGYQQSVCQKCYRFTPMVNLVRLTVKSKTILKRAGVFIPTGEFL